MYRVSVPSVGDLDYLCRAGGQDGIQQGAARSHQLPMFSNYLSLYNS